MKEPLLMSILMALVLLNSFWSGYLYAGNSHWVFIVGAVGTSAMVMFLSAFALWWRIKSANQWKELAELEVDKYKQGDSD